VLASTVVVVAGLRAGRAILLPSALALFLAILSLPVMLWFQRKGVPGPIAIFLAVMADIAIFGAIVLLAAQSVADFQSQIPEYTATLQIRIDEIISSLEAREIPAREYVGGVVGAEAMTALVQSLFGQVTVFFRSAFVVVFILVFMLAEAAIFPKKFRAVIGDYDGDLSRFSKITGEVFGYLIIKTVISLVTGITIGVWAWIMGLDFPILLGLIGFLLNYVPIVGSILAAIPGVILALVEHGTVGPAIIVAIGYLVINTIFGNLIEPHLQGRRLGISTLIVVLSLFFWAWAWGPVGALLAVPLTMVVKIVLENTEDLRWVAVLLDREAPSTPLPKASLLPLGSPLDSDR
jgi:predicted PurR-regulated permease PerM